MLNPVAYTEQVVRDFLKYQITAYPFADDEFYGQMRTLLNLEQTRDTPLMQGPYVSLSRAFREGARLEELVIEGLIHAHLRQLAPFPRLYHHQEQAIRAIVGGHTTLVSTGTGSGKTECFLYPIISKGLELRDAGAPDGISAVIVYPMNALAEDQVERVRGLLAGTGVSFGMYIGKTVENEADVTGERLPTGASHQDYLDALERRNAAGQTHAIHPPEERVSRQMMRTPGQRPRILMTNVKQLELLLTRQKDIELFDGARLDYLVFDEAHTFKGAAGAETACLIRRLRTFCGRRADETVCIATSATIADPEGGGEAGRDFAARFFGVDRDGVELVSEAYRPDTWASERTMPDAVSDAGFLQRILEAVALPDEKIGAVLAPLVHDLCGATVSIDTWQEDLYLSLARNELVCQMAEALEKPRPLAGLLDDLEVRVGRAVSEEELIMWLALGAASRMDKRPLLRPVLHAFVRGVSGAVVTFPAGRERPRLSLSAEDAASASGDDTLYPLPVMSCTTCGQHYFHHYAHDFSFTDGKPAGGNAEGRSSVWPAMQRPDDRHRVVLVDRVVHQDISDDEDPPAHSAEVFFCRHCGALHPRCESTCLGCGRPGNLVRLFAMSQRRDAAGKLPRCVSCGTSGRATAGRFREPARPVRAITVSDVHVLAQNMIPYAERRRLLVFADNRQDAAFQSGWMRDHGRRFHLRALMYRRLDDTGVSIGDLVAYLEQELDADDELSRSLIPEVWDQYRKQDATVHHTEERQKFLRIQVLRELNMGLKQRIGLEPWGRMKVTYQGLNEHDPFFVRWAQLAGTEPEIIFDGVGNLLDTTRRRDHVLFDRELQLYTRFWHEGSREIQRGYMPMMLGGPKGLKLQRAAGDNPNRVAHWLSHGGLTGAKEAARKWGIPSNDADRFLTELWDLLTVQAQLLVPVTLLNQRGRAVANCAGIHQIDADRILLSSARDVFRCGLCHRVHGRLTPNMACMGYRCEGTLQFEEENPDDYDLMVLDREFAMVRSREHSAQVPNEERATLERMFKSPGELLNTLVCTPTLELGVNIGELDAVLMRNVPPLPANYWQRAGRAGREHRMAVNITYARPASHDRAYFADPLKLLRGTILPPSFNLRNRIMVERHVHAAILTVLFGLANDNSALEEGARDRLRSVLAHCFPRQISPYFFDLRRLRTEPLDVSALRTEITVHRHAVLHHLQTVFSQGWPEDAGEVVCTEELGVYVGQTVDRLEEVILRIWRRLRWALDQMSKLEDLRRIKGTLDPDEDAQYARCDRLVKKLKGEQRRRRSEAEGFDDTNTYGVMAFEGFLPGYGLETGSVLATAQMPRFSMNSPDLALPRPSAIALREFVPGNMIYANNHKFLPRYFHLSHTPPMLFQVDPANEAVAEVGTAAAGVGMGIDASTLRVVEICDVDLPHHSFISDDEDYRFQMGVSVYGYELDRHNGGARYRWGERSILFRRGVHLRLVNVGATSLVEEQGVTGYPVCLACGQSRSALAGQVDLDNFNETHETRCGQAPGRIGFSSDTVADCLSFAQLPDRGAAYSLAEALRIAAASVLDMEIDDLQILVIGFSGRDEVDALLYDPMPGGSGLLEQLLSRWGEIAAGALELVTNCPSRCESACVDCLYLFRNAYYHRHLSRHTAREYLDAAGGAISFEHDIPPKMPNSEPEPDALPVNEAEARLRHLLLAAGFPSPEGQKEIVLNHTLGRTYPDAYYDDVDDSREPGICIYLDGMSEHLHGDPPTRDRDRQIREELRSQGYEVFEIPYGDLFDRRAMTHFMGRLARQLTDRAHERRLRDDTHRFDSDEKSERGTILEWLAGDAVQPYKNAVPFYALEAAAGDFSPTQNGDAQGWLRVDGRKLREGMFAARVVGKSMEPTVPDGAYCLFSSPVTGDRGGRRLLVQLHDSTDPETSARFTLKRYESEKEKDPDGSWRHVAITLRPDNPEFEPLVFTDNADDALSVIAEFVAVLGMDIEEG